MNGPEQPDQTEDADARRARRAPPPPPPPDRRATSLYKARPDLAQPESVPRRQTGTHIARPDGDPWAVMRRALDAFLGARMIPPEGEVEAPDTGLPPDITRKLMQLLQVAGGLPWDEPFPDQESFATFVLGAPTAPDDEVLHELRRLPRETLERLTLHFARDLGTRDNDVRRLEARCHELADPESDGLDAARRAQLERAVLEAQARSREADERAEREKQAAARREQELRDAATLREQEERTAREAELAAQRAELERAGEAARSARDLLLAAKTARIDELLARISAYERERQQTELVVKGLDQVGRASTGEAPTPGTGELTARMSSAAEASKGKPEVSRARSKGDATPDAGNPVTRAGPRHTETGAFARSPDAGAATRSGARPAGRPTESGVRPGPRSTETSSSGRVMRTTVGDGTPGVGNVKPGTPGVGNSTRSGVRPITQNITRSGLRPATGAGDVPRRTEGPAGATLEPDDDDDDDAGSS